MSLQDASKLPDREHLVIRNPAKLVDDAVKGRGCVALRKDEEVAAVPLRVLRVIVHEAREIEDREDIRCRERSSRMSRPGLGQHLYDIVADCIRHELYLVRRAVRRPALAFLRHSAPVFRLPLPVGQSLSSYTQDAQDVSISKESMGKTHALPRAGNRAFT